MHKLVSLALLLCTLQLCFSDTNITQPLEILNCQTNVTIEGGYANIIHTLVYHNPNDFAIEASFDYSRTDGSILSNFKASINDSLVTEVILPGQQAEDMYSMGLSHENTTDLSSQGENPDTDYTNTNPIKISTGYIAANDTIEVQVTIIEPLDVVSNIFWGFKLTNSWDVNCSAIVTVNSNSSFVSLINPDELEAQFVNTTTSTISLYQAIYNLTIIKNHTFALYFRTDDINEPAVLLAAHPTLPNDYVMQVSFIPLLNNISVSTAETFLSTGDEVGLDKEVLNEDIKNATGEFIFVIDRSGSMMGQKIESLKQALKQFLQTLPQNSYFNIISFGTNFSAYQPQSIAYNKDNLNKAFDFIKTIQADFSGTEIFNPLNDVVQNMPLKSLYPRTVMLLTDGEVDQGETDRVVNLVKNNSDLTRFCAVGIGEGVSQELVLDIQKYGNCPSTFVSGDSNMGNLTVGIVQGGISQFLKNITFTIQCFDQSQTQIFTQQENTTLLLKNQPFMQWVYLQNITNISSIVISLSYYNSLTASQESRNLTINGVDSALITDKWHKVAYDDKIRSLDVERTPGQSEDTENDIISQIQNLSTKYQVVSNYTAILSVLQENITQVNGTTDNSTTGSPQITILTPSSVALQNLGSLTVNTSLENDAEARISALENLSGLIGMHIQVESGVQGGNSSGPLIPPVLPPDVPTDDGNNDQAKLIYAAIGVCSTLLCCLLICCVVSREKEKKRKRETAEQVGSGSYEQVTAGYTGYTEL